MRSLPAPELFALFSQAYDSSSISLERELRAFAISLLLSLSACYAFVAFDPSLFAFSYSALPSVCRFYTSSWPSSSSSSLVGTHNKFRGHDRPPGHRQSGSGGKRLSPAIHRSDTVAQGSWSLCDCSCNHTETILVCLRQDEFMDSDTSSTMGITDITAVRRKHQTQISLLSDIEKGRTVQRNTGEAAKKSGLLLSHCRNSGLQQGAQSASAILTTAICSYAPTFCAPRGSIFVVARRIATQCELMLRLMYSQREVYIVERPPRAEWEELIGLMRKRRSKSDCHMLHLWRADQQP